VSGLVLERPGAGGSRDWGHRLAWWMISGNADGCRPRSGVEGSAARVRDESLLKRLAAMWESKLDWPFEVADGGFRERTSEIARSVSTGFADERLSSPAVRDI
jgi:hypothetical protein